MVPPEFLGYRKINNGENNYDLFEFYDQMLTGKVPYTISNKTQYVGPLSQNASVNYAQYNKPRYIYDDRFNKNLFALIKFAEGI